MISGGSPGADDYVDLITPDGRPFWTSPAMYDPKKKAPTYTTTQVGKFFFAYGTPWMYKYLIVQQLTSHPEVGELDLLRTDSKLVPARRWRLYDVEMFTHILGAHGVLEGIQVARTIRIVKLSAELWGYRL